MRGENRTRLGERAPVARRSTGPPTERDRFGAVIVNTFSAVAAFAAILRGVLAVVVLVAGAAAIRKWRQTREAGEERFHLVVGSCVTLALLAVVSWPLLYLVLSSYVPLWPGIMCIQGVTRIGTGSVGAASWLPLLLSVLAVTKPLLVFASGIWLVLHLANRRSRTGALTGKVLAALLACGLLALLDSGVETAYLFIPKQEKILAAGCCGADVTTVSSPASALPTVASEPGARGPLSAAFLALGGSLVLALTGAIRRAGTGGGPWLWLSLAGAVASLPLGLAFLGRVAAPWFLRLPYHECAYCLVSRRIETAVGIGLYVLGAFAVGWAFAARGNTGDGGTGEGATVPLLRLARFGYLGSLLMTSVMMVSS